MAGPRMVPGIRDSYEFPVFIIQQLPTHTGGSPGVHVLPGHDRHHTGPDHSAVIQWLITDRR
ncbi:hypothetical protein GCM10017687_28890 [Streptomyces echinatus]